MESSERYWLFDSDKQISNGYVYKEKESLLESVATLPKGE